MLEGLYIYTLIFVSICFIRIIYNIEFRKSDTLENTEDIKKEFPYLIAGLVIGLLTLALIPIRLGDN